MPFAIEFDGEERQVFRVHDEKIEVTLKGKFEEFRRDPASFNPSFAEQRYRFPLIDWLYLYPAAYLSPVSYDETDRFRELWRN